MGKKLLFIINPVSGRRIYRRSLADLILAFEENGYEVSAYLTEKRGDATEMAACLGPKFDRIVCLGGDGTLGEVINGLARIDFSVPLGYIPAGSTNDFAATMDISQDHISAALDAARGEEKALDVLRIGSRCYINTANIGIFTSVAYSVPQGMKNAVGQLAYVLGGIKDLSKLRAERIRLTTADNVFEGDYLFGAICNSCTLTLGPRPEGNVPDDGRFDALFIKKPAHAADLQKTVLQLLGRNFPSENIDYFQADSMTVEMAAPGVWSVDGERYDAGSYCPVEVLHKKLRFIVPPRRTEQENVPPLKRAGRWLTLDIGKNEGGGLSIQNRRRSR